jgi:hypothetical protein
MRSIQVFVAGLVTTDQLQYVHAPFLLQHVVTTLVLLPDQDKQNKVVKSLPAQEPEIVWKARKW